jgi:hypothetical protein
VGGRIEILGFLKFTTTGDLKTQYIHVFSKYMALQRTQVCETPDSLQHIIIIIIIIIMALQPSVGPWPLL